MATLDEVKSQISRWYTQQESRMAQSAMSVALGFEFVSRTARHPDHKEIAKRLLTRLRDEKKVVSRVRQMWEAGDSYIEVVNHGVQEYRYPRV